MQGQDWFESYVVQGNYVEELARIPAERTEQEATFIATALALPKGRRILDLCCGIGRHTVALAQRGYRMVGLDLDRVALNIAAARAQEEHVQIELYHNDMRSIPFVDEIDGIINIFSSFGVYGSDDEDVQVLDSVARALSSRGVFLIDTINREYIFRNYRTNTWQRRSDGTLILVRRELDLNTSRHVVTETSISPDGDRTEHWHRFRFYALTEMIKMFKDVGLTVEDTWGDFEGSPYSLESRRMIILARKSI